MPLRASDPPSEVDIGEVVGDVRGAHDPRRRPGPGRPVGGKVSAEGEIPRALVEEIEDVLELAGFRRHVLDARQLTVDTVEHFNADRKDDSGQQPPIQEQPGDEEAENPGSQCHLVRRDRCRRQKTDEKVLERRIEIGRRQILRPLLDVIEEHAPGTLDVGVIRDSEQVHGHVAALLADVGIERRQRREAHAGVASGPQGIEPAGIDGQQQLRALFRRRSDGHVHRLHDQPIEQPLVDQQVTRHDHHSIPPVNGLGDHPPSVRTRGRHPGHGTIQPCRGTRKAKPRGADDVNTFDPLGL